MLTISNPIKGRAAVDYYLDEVAGYYVGEPSRAEWFGTGAERWGLKGEPTAKEFENLLLGFSPSGQPWVQNAGHEKRQRGHDLTLSCNKYVSELFAQSPPDVRSKLLEDVLFAVKTVLSKVEREAVETRRGKGGKIRESAELFFLLKVHIESRDHQPQLHVHCVMPNVGLRKDGTTGSLHTKPLFEMKMELGLLFQQTLAKRLEARGRPIDWQGDNFKIPGIPDSLCQAHSSRRTAIKAWLKEHGVSDAISAKTAAIKTRKKKTKVPEHVLFAEWQREGRAHGFGPEQAAKLFRNDLRPAPAEKKSAEEIRNVKTDIERHRIPSGFREPANEDAAPKNIPPHAPGTGSREERNSKKKSGKASHRNAEKEKPDKSEPKKSAERRDKASFFEKRHQTVFSRAPRWNRLNRLRVPYWRRVKVVDSSGKPLVKFETHLAALRFQIRNSRIFPNAPKWSPFHDRRVWNIAIKQKTDSQAAEFGLGDRVRFNRKDKFLRVERGEQGFVAQRTENFMLVELTSGQCIYVSFRRPHDITNLSEDRLSGSREKDNRAAEEEKKKEREKAHREQERVRREQEEARRREERRHHL